MALGQEASDRANRAAVLASVATATVLVALKLWAYAATGSLAVAASLADSALDLMVSLGGLAAVIYAARPPDDDHAFGHSSAEDLAALGQALFILFSAGAIGIAAARRLIAGTPPPLAGEALGLLVMGVSILLTIALVMFQGRIARRTGNRVVAADRLHYLGDLVPNIGAIAALAASSAFGLWQVDGIVALGAAAMLAGGALRIGAGAWHALMDRAADPEIVAGIAEIASRHPGLAGFHDLKTRTAGSRVFVNIHVEIDGRLSLQEAHGIGAALRREIMRRYPRCDVIIHKDPV